MKYKLIIDRRGKKLVWSSIILILGVILWIIAIVNYSYLSDYYGAVSLRYKQPVVTGQQIDTIIEEMISREDNNIPEVTLWQRNEDIIIANEEMNTSVSIGLITVNGDMSRIYPNSMLHGGYLAKGDYAGCVIDQNTAYKLFHSENAIGLTISLDKKEYIVCGIMRDLGSNAMVIQEEKQMLSRKEGIKYSCMELVFSNTADAKRLAERFIHTYSLGTPRTYIDGYMYQRISYLIIHMPLWFSALLLILYIIRKVNKLRASRVLFVGGWLGIILLSAILICMTKVQINYSSAMLPTRWSDFDFWSNQWKLLITSLEGREGSILYYKDMILERRMVFILGGVIMTVISIGVSSKVLLNLSSARAKPELSVISNTDTS